MSTKHRKSCKRYDIPGDVHALTFSRAGRSPFVSRERCCQWMLDALVLGREKDLFDLWAYVIMPEHVHLVIWPHSGFSIAQILKCVKRSVSKRAIHWLENNDSKYLVTRRDGDDRPKPFSFWQRGGGYDRNLRSVADIHEKIEYVHNNPVRRTLVPRASLWHWSSAFAWETGRDEPIAIDRSSVPRLIITG